MAERDLVYLPIRLERDTYEAFRRLVGTRRMSPTARKLIEDYVVTERVLRAIEETRGDEDD